MNLVKHEKTTPAYACARTYLAVDVGGLDGILHAILEVFRFAQAKDRPWYPDGSSSAYPKQKYASDHCIGAFKHSPLLGGHANFRMLVPTQLALLLLPATELSCFHRPSPFLSWISEKSAITSKSLPPAFH